MNFKLFFVFSFFLAGLYARFNSAQSVNTIMSQIDGHMRIIEKLLGDHVEILKALPNDDFSKLQKLADASFWNKRSITEQFEMIRDRMSILEPKMISLMRFRLPFYRTQIQRYRALKISVEELNRRRDDILRLNQEQRASVERILQGRYASPVPMALLYKDPINLEIIRSF